MGLAIVDRGLQRPELRFNGPAPRERRRVLPGCRGSGPSDPVPCGSRGYRVPHAELRMPGVVAVILLMTSGCSRFFTLEARRRLFGTEDHPMERGSGAPDPGRRDGETDWSERVQRLAGYGMAATGSYFP